MKIGVFWTKIPMFFQNSDQNRQFLSKIPRFQMKQAPLNPRIKFFRNFRLKNFLEKISWFKLSRNNAEQAEHVSKNKPDDRFNNCRWGEWLKISTFLLKISTKAPKTFFWANFGRVLGLFWALKLVLYAINIPDKILERYLWFIKVIYLWVFSTPNVILTIF